MAEEVLNTRCRAGQSKQLGWNVPSVRAHAHHWSVLCSVGRWPCLPCQLGGTGSGIPAPAAALLCLGVFHAVTAMGTVSSLLPYSPSTSWAVPRVENHLEQPVKELPGSRGCSLPVPSPH